MPTRTIKAIFYTRFHHEKGNRVLHQVPSGSIIPSTLPSALPTPLFPFSSITQYLIPNQQFCDRLLTFCVNHYRVIGYPVCIREGKYSRNEFIFNFALVIGENELDWVCYGEVVRKLGRLLRGLEEQGGFLSREEKGVWEDDNGLSAGTKDEAAGAGEVGIGGGSKVHALCEMVLEDLNNYAECMIPIDDSNTINLKLFPTRPPPPPVFAHQVPLLTMSLSSLQTPISSDLTLNRVLPYINGVNSISHIAQLADTDLSLTRRAVQHLLYYGCLVLLDIFSFGAIYAPTAEIGGFVVDADIKDECMRYVRVPKVRVGSDSKMANIGKGADKGRDDRSTTSSSTSQHSDSAGGQTLKTSKFDSHMSLQKAADDDDEEEWNIDHETLITLYTSLRQGLTLKNWVLENLDLLRGIDIRRFITFGIIKGLLYRVHKYAIANSTSLPPAPPASLETSAATSLHNGETSTIRGGANAKTTATTAPAAITTTSQQQHQSHPSFSFHKPSISTSLTPHLAHLPQLSHSHPAPHTEDSGLASLASDREKDMAQMLVRFLDGMHCFDEICCELEVPEKVVERHVRGLGDGLGVIVQK